MRYIATLKDSDFGLPDKNPSGFKLRRAARGVIIDDQKRILMMYVTKFNDYKTPGGGVDDGEDIEEALKREMLEEAGCRGEIIDKIGQIQEFRSEFDQEQISDIFLVKMTSIEQNHLTEAEINNGFKIVWFDDIDQAIDTLEDVEIDHYADKFIAKRELLTLKSAKGLIDKL